MSVPFKELPGSPVETFGAEGLRAQRRVLVAWEDRHRMVLELLGDGQQFGGLPSAGYPACSAAIAAEVRLEPWPPAPDDQGPFADITVQLNSYSGKFAQIVVDYELLDTSHARRDLPQAQQGTLLSYRMDFGGEYLTLAGETLRWESDPTIPVPAAAVPTIRVPVSEHHLTWHRAVNPPWEAMRSCAGTVNQSAFLGAPAETVLFEGATADKRFLGIDGLRLPAFGWQITYVFRERTIKAGGSTFGWNHRYRPLPQDFPGWDRLVDQRGQPLYRTSDFTPLFQFGAVA